MARRAVTSGVFAAIVGLGATVVTAGEQPTGAKAPMIMNLINRPAESQEKAYNEALKAEAQAPAPSPVDQWEAQPDGSMRHKKSGVTIAVRNPCPPGDIEHEFALAAYNRAMARAKPRR